MYPTNMSPFELNVTVTPGVKLYDALYHAKYKCAELGMMYINFTLYDINYSISNKCNINAIIKEVEMDILADKIKPLYKD